MIDIKEIGITALRKAYETHEKIGIKGEDLIRKNQFGDTALRADVEIERTIIEFLKKMNIPIRVISEEHGITNITENPKYLGIMDGLDGSEVYKKERGKGRYGTMFAIFFNLDPKYEDYIFSGVIEHSKKRLFYAIKGRGSFLIENGRENRIFCSKVDKLDKKTKIYVDEYFEFNRKTFSSKLQGFNIKCLLSSSMHYVDLANGKVDLVLECTRKRNLEIAIAFGLITESTGTIMTIDGKNIGKEKYLEFRQEDGYIPIIFSCTEKLGKELIKKVT